MVADWFMDPTDIESRDLETTEQPLQIADRASVRDSFLQPFLLQHASLSLGRHFPGSLTKDATGQSETENLKSLGENLQNQRSPLVNRSNQSHNQQFEPQCLQSQLPVSNPNLHIMDHSIKSQLPDYSKNCQSSMTKSTLELASATETFKVPNLNQSGPSIVTRDVLVPSKVSSKWQLDTFVCQDLGSHQIPDRQSGHHTAESSSNLLHQRVSQCVELVESHNLYASLLDQLAVVAQSTSVQQNPVSLTTADRQSVVETPQHPLIPPHSIEKSIQHMVNTPYGSEEFKEIKSHPRARDSFSPIIKVRKVRSTPDQMAIEFTPPKICLDTP